MFSDKSMVTFSVENNLAEYRDSLPRGGHRSQYVSPGILVNHEMRGISGPPSHLKGLSSLQGHCTGLFVFSPVKVISILNTSAYRWDEHSRSVEKNVGLYGGCRGRTETESPALVLVTVPVSLLWLGILSSHCPGLLTVVGDLKDCLGDRFADTGDSPLQPFLQPWH